MGDASRECPSSSNSERRAPVAASNASSGHNRARVGSAFCSTPPALPVLISPARSSVKSANRVTAMRPSLRVRVWVAPSTITSFGAGTPSTRNAFRAVWITRCLTSRSSERNRSSISPVGVMLRMNSVTPCAGCMNWPAFRNRDVTFCEISTLRSASIFWLAGTRRLAKASCITITHRPKNSTGRASRNPDKPVACITTSSLSCISRLIT